MKIAHVLRRLSPANWGGIEQEVRHLAKAQREAGHEVRIFATAALCSTPHETMDGVEVRRFGYVYPWWPMTAANRERLDLRGGNPFAPGLERALRGWRPDVIHCHAMARLAELCIRVAERTGARSVISLHGGAANVPTAEAESLRAPMRRLFPWGALVERALRRKRRIPGDFGGIVCVGEDEAAIWRERHPRVMFLPNGVDCGVFGDAAARPAEPRGAARRIVCVARIDPQKNQLALVEAVSRHADWTLRLVGGATQPDYRAELEARAAALGLAGRVSFAGQLPPDSPALAAEYAAADVFALASRHEPFGIVVLEAWAAGLPVIAADVGGLGRLCAAYPEAARTFPPGDADALDTALSGVLSDRALAARMGEAGRAAARLHDWAALAARLLSFYETIPHQGDTT